MSKKQTKECSKSSNDKCYKENENNIRSKESAREGATISYQEVRRGLIRPGAMAQLTNPPLASIETQCGFHFVFLLLHF